MEERNIQTVWHNALTGFIPSAFLFMVVLGLGLPFFLSGGNLDAIRHVHWGVFLLELLLISIGYVGLMILLTPQRVSYHRGRSIFAGIGAVLTMLILSFFLQGAGLFTIIGASLAAGMIAALVMLTRPKTDKLLV